MNHKVLINTFLLIILLHLILKTIDYNITFSPFGKIVPSMNFKENYGNAPMKYMVQNQNNNLPTYQESMDFLLDTDEDPAELDEINYVDNQHQQQKNKQVTEQFQTQNNHFKKLLTYVNGCPKDSVKAGNYYITDENSSNFRSNVMNVQKFYNTDTNGLSYDGLTNEQLTERLNMNKLNNQKNFNKIKNQSCFPERNKPILTGKDNTMIDKPDNWNYKNDFVMNGGQFVGNVVGYNDLTNGYATFNQRDPTMVDNFKNMNCQQQPDDIRMGLGLPNASERATL